MAKGGEITTPENLLRRLGEPRINGKWYVWGGSKDWYDDGVIIWTPGMRFAKNKKTGELIEASTEVPLPYRWTTDRKMVEVPWRYCDESQEVYEYLEGRGLTPGEILQYCVYNPDFPVLAIFPIMEDGVLVAWQGRRIDEGEPKYHSGRSEDGWLTAHETAWGLDRLLPGHPAWVCQGIPDALYFETGVAVMGDQVKEKQAVKIIDRKPSPIVIVHDGTEKLRGAEVFATLTGTDVYEQVPPEGFKDFGELLPLGQRYDKEGEV